MRNGFLDMSVRISRQDRIRNEQAEYSTNVAYDIHVIQKRLVDAERMNNSRTLNKL